MAGPDRDSPLLMVMPYQQFFAKAAAEGFRICAIWDPSYQPAAYLDRVAALADELILTDFADRPALRDLVRRTALRRGASHVLHLGREDSQLPVAEEAHALGLAPNPPQALAAINDKAAMRRLLATRGLSPVRSVEVADPARLPAALAQVGLPAVVKPARLDGSRGVRLVREPSEVDGWAAGLRRYGYRGPVLVEEYLRGEEFSVETFTVAGRHHLVGITAKRLGPPPGFVELGHLHPAPLPEPARAAIAAVVTGLLDATGYQFGPAHTEVIMTAGGPRIVESQTRIGGDRIPLLVRLATGFDLEAAVFAALAGKPVRPRPATRFGCVAFFDLGAGRLVSVTGLDEIRRLPFVHELRFGHRPGDLLPPVLDSGSRHGHVVIDADSEQQAADRIGQVRGLLRAVVRPGGERSPARPGGERSAVRPDGAADSKPDSEKVTIP